MLMLQHDNNYPYVRLIVSVSCDGKMQPYRLQMIPLSLGGGQTH